MGALVREQEAKSSPNHYREGYPDMIDGVTCVIVNERDFARLPTYDCSVPTGVCAGKVWKRKDADGLWLGSFEDYDPPRPDSVIQRFRRLRVSRPVESTGGQEP
jgi:hypothetical protein